MKSVRSLLPRRAWFMAAIFTLLAVNTAVFLASGTASEALDSIAWLTLLALFELETGRIVSQHEGHSISAIRTLRLAAVAALVAAMIGYVHEEEWLDALNVGLWCAVVALLEFEVRRPDAVMRNRSTFVAATFVLYAGLTALVAAWLWRGELFEAYDAALWLVAFATLEMDVLGLFRKHHLAV